MVRRDLSDGGPPPAPGGDVPAAGQAAKPTTGAAALTAAGDPAGASTARRRRLPRRLGIWSAASVVFGMIIGSGIFRVPGTVARDVTSAGALGLLWAVGGAVALAGALTVAELAAMFPRSGGIYVYLYESYGRLPAFLFGWTDTLIVRPGSLAAVGLILTAYLTAFVPMGDAAQRATAAAIIVGLGVVNYRSVSWGGVVQAASSLAKVVALVGLAVAIFALGHASEGALARAPARLTPAHWGGFGVALVAVLWAYDGWADMPALSGEVREPGRTLPRALVYGIAVVLLTYLAVNAAFLYVLPVRAMAASRLVAADAATRIFGDAGARIVAALVILATFSTLNALLMTGPRFIYAMAEDGLFFKRLGAVHPRFRTPHNAVVLTTLLGVAYVSSRTFEQLTNAIILGEWPFYALAVAAVILLRRRRPATHRPYRTPGYPLVPMAFVAAAIALLLNAAVQETLLTLASFAVIASGVPVYFFWRHGGAGA